MILVHLNLFYSNYNYIIFKQQVQLCSFVRFMYKYTERLEYWYSIFVEDQLLSNQGVTHRLRNGQVCGPYLYCLWINLDVLCGSSSKNLTRKLFLMVKVFAEILWSCWPIFLKYLCLQVLMRYFAKKSTVCQHENQLSLKSLDLDFSP